MTTIRSPLRRHRARQSDQAPERFTQRSHSMHLFYTLQLSSTQAPRLAIDPTALLPGAKPPTKQIEEEALTFDGPVRVNTLTTLTKVRRKRCRSYGDPYVHVDAFARSSASPTVNVARYPCPKGISIINAFRSCMHFIHERISLMNAFQPLSYFSRFLISSGLTFLVSCNDLLFYFGNCFARLECCLVFFRSIP